MVIPAILEKNINEIKRKISLVDRVADLVQIDIADGKLVNGTSLTNLDEIESINSLCDIELHLMVVNPLDYLTKKLWNVSNILIQVESSNVKEAIEKAKNLGYTVGAVISPDTDLSELQKYVNQVDYVQFMTVIPGAQGRDFEEKVLSKISIFRKNNPTVLIQIDGAIDKDDINEVLNTGVNNVVIGSAIFMNNTAQNPIIAVSNGTVSRSKTARKIKRIAFLGGAAWEPNDEPYKQAFEVAKILAAQDYRIINGGGPGVMRAATLGAHAAGKTALAVTYHPNKPKIHYEGVDLENTFDEEIITLDYFDRTKVMLQTSELHIIFKGSIGTLSELGMTWISSWIHEPDNKPVILYGEFWHQMLTYFKKEFLIVQNEDHMMKICTTPQEVLDYVQSLG